MPLFKRRRGRATDADRIGEFWSWWTSTGAALVADAIARKETAETSGMISDHVRRIDDRLDWELGPGLLAAHVLVITAAGDPVVRGIARRWLRAAPPSDQLWEYADMRRPGEVFTIQFEGLPPVPIEAGLVTIDPDDSAAAVHVGVHHPAFPDLPVELQQRVTFLMLDLMLGEEMVETWVGGIKTLASRPADAQPISALLPAVASFASEHTLEDGSPAWRMLEGTVNGHPLIATAEYPLRSIRRPQLDTHVAISVGYPVIRQDGLPEDKMLDSLRDLEDHLTDRLGDSGRLLAHETSAGTRTLHYYVDGTTPAAGQLQAALGGWQHGRVDLSVSPDAGWDDLSHLRG
jgi:hypothetical protein